MNAKTKHDEPAPVLVKARDIARMLSVTPRYVLYLAAEDRIPSIRFGRDAKRCLRFDPKAVLKAIGHTTTEAAAARGADQ